MIAVKRNEDLMCQLPRVRGTYQAFAELGMRSWFRTGGTAEVLFEPVDVQDLKDFMANRPCGVPLSVIGFGSNLLIRDGGVEGVVILLGAAFSKIRFHGARVIVGAAAMDVNVARIALTKGISGFEFLSGIPGTIGGAIRMNAGAYGVEIGDIVKDATVVDTFGRIHVMNAGQMNFSYRQCGVPAGWVVVSSTLQGEFGNMEDIQGHMTAISSARQKSQPLTRTGGSTFANPPGEKAWKLIAEAGCRGLRRGDAMVSEQHCNFLLNLGSASSSDLELLGEEIRQRVFDKTGVCLDWEIQRIGNSRRGEEL